jgi:hypothetical protein
MRSDIQVNVPSGYQEDRTFSKDVGEITENCMINTSVCAYERGRRLSVPDEIDYHVEYHSHYVQRNP